MKNVKPVDISFPRTNVVERGKSREEIVEEVASSFAKNVPIIAHISARDQGVAIVQGNARFAAAMAVLDEFTVRDIDTGKDVVVSNKSKMRRP